MEDRFVLRRAQLKDLTSLAQLHRRTFHETFIEDLSIPYPDEDLQEYFRHFASEEYFRSKLFDDHYAMWIIEDQLNKELLAYALVGRCEALPHEDLQLNEDGQIHRFYVRRDYRNHQFGQRLMKETLQYFEKSFPQKTIWLTVFSENTKAQRFYSHYGFSLAGEFLYPVGKWNDREFIMRKIFSSR